MSSSHLEEKENVNILNEFAKEGKTTSTNSILKPSQKENVLSVQQLTPQKPPKVSFYSPTKIIHFLSYNINK